MSQHNRNLEFCGAQSAPQNSKSWISKAQSAFEIQLLEKIERLSDLLSPDRQS
jgi:hypothetical protein